MEHPIDLVGTIRERPPEETLDRLLPLLPHLGITRLAHVGGLDHIGIPVSLAVRPLSRSLSVSQGKGITRALADVSAIMESVEGFHSEHLREPVVVASFADLRAAGRLAIAPSTLVPGRLEIASGIDDCPIAWIDATDIRDDQPWLVPRSAVCLDFTAVRREHAALVVSSNGLAAGNSRDEAVLHGIYEVVERDAHAKWERMPADAIAATEIDTATIGGSCGDLIAMFRRAGVRVRTWDATGETGVPTFVCHIRGSGDSRSLSTYGGAGAHGAKEIALSRALTEAAQSRLTFITGSRDDCPPERYAIQRAAAGELVDVPSSGRAKPFSACPSLSICDSFARSIAQVTERLASIGLDRVLVVDLTRDDVGIPVVHVVIPGLAHHY
jgi:YcaO-like protein with predicted kinase domain